MSAWIIKLQREIIFFNSTYQISEFFNFIYSCLHIAAAKGLSDVVSTLVERGANVLAEDKQGRMISHT